MSHVSDALDDDNLAEDPFFRDAKFCWLLENPACILRVRNQKNTNSCVPFTVTAAMYAEEVLNRGTSTLGSVQELFDYVMRYKRPTRRVKKVPIKGYNSSFSVTYAFIMNYLLSPEYIYPWFGETTYERIDSDWDFTVRSVELKALNSTGGRSVYDINGEIPSEKKILLGSYKKISRYDIPPTSDPEVMYREEVPLTAVTKQLHMQPLTGCIRFTHVLRQWKGPRGLEIFKGDGINLGNHAVLVVGYGGKGDNAYFIVQNSHGVEWGYKGYFKILRTLITGFYAPHGVRSPPRSREDDDSPPKRSADLEEDDDSPPKRSADLEEAQGEAMGFNASKRQRFG